MKDYPVKAGSILKFRRFDHDDYKKTNQGIEKTDDYDRIGRAAWELQERLYANGNRPVLIVLVLQGNGYQRQGRDDQERDVRCESAELKSCAFKAPSLEELWHDFLWHVHQKACQRVRSASSTACITRTY